MFDDLVGIVAGDRYGREAWEEEEIEEEGEETALIILLLF